MCILLFWYLVLKADTSSGGATLGPKGALPPTPPQIKKKKKKKIQLIYILNKSYRYHLKILKEKINSSPITVKYLYAFLNSINLIL